MQQTTSELQAAVRATYTKIDRVLLVRDGAVLREVEATSGEVVAANDAQQTRRFTAEVADPTGELTPYQLDDEAAPFGTEAWVQTGARIPVTTEETLVVETGGGWDDHGTRVNTVVNGSGSLVLGFS